MRFTCIVLGERRLSRKLFIEVVDELEADRSSPNCCACKSLVEADKEGGGCES